MRDLIPYETILAAKAGDFEAMDIVLKHYAPLITKHSIRVFYYTLEVAFNVSFDEFKKLSADTKNLGNDKAEIYARAE